MGATTLPLSMLLKNSSFSNLFHTHIRTGAVAERHTDILDKGQLDGAH